MILSIAMALAAPGAAPQWAPVAITDNDGTLIYFVDRANIAAAPEGPSAWVYTVGETVALRLHFQYDCASERSRAVEAAMGSSAAQWSPVKPQTPLGYTMRYVCAGGKIDLGFGDLAVPAPTPEAFARAFLTRRAAARNREAITR